MRKTSGLDALVDGFDFTQLKNESAASLEPVTFWLPSEYKSKYDELQAKSGKRFGKLLKQVLMQSIDKVRAP